MEIKVLSLSRLRERVGECRERVFLFSLSPTLLPQVGERCWRIVIKLCCPNILKYV
jgi:hypothetical protein